LLNLSNIEIRVSDRSLFNLVDLKLTKGLIALVGRNGTGKSTFLKTILGEHQNYCGEIRLNNIELSKIEKSERAKLISVVYSKPEIFGNHTVREVLLLGRLPYQNLFAKVTEKDIQVVEKIIVLLELESFIDKEFLILSDGEKQMVMIGRALVQDTQIILLDEPGAFLDVVNRYKLSDVLKKIVAETNKLIIYSTHHIDLLESHCNAVLLISEGKMIALNEPNQFLPKIKQTFGI